MKIIILTERPFPYGMAATNRLVAYSSGMVEAGAQVSILCTKATEQEGSNSKNSLIEGSYNGIDYKYVTGTTIRPSSAFKRVILYFKGYSRGIRELRQISKESHIDVLFMGLSNFWFTWSFFRWSRKNNTLFVQERSEYPFIGISGVMQKLNLWFYLRVTCKFFDVIVVITHALEEYFYKWKAGNAGIYLLPMLVESRRFKKQNLKPGNLPKKYIAYVGSMQGNKDGLPILIESFAKISELHPDVHLVLIGETNFAGFDELQYFVENLGVIHKVHFTGRIERDELPPYLEEASFLALARPTSKQAEGGFPNKLGEYLATGKPVIITSVGEIPLFLEDGKNAFISNPDDSHAFAEKLEEALNDPDKAKKIGEAGFELIETVFQPKMQARKMLEYFTEIIERLFHHS